MKGKFESLLAREAHRRRPGIENNSVMKLNFSGLKKILKGDRKIIIQKIAKLRHK